MNYVAWLHASRPRGDCRHHRGKRSMPGFGSAREPEIAPMPRPANRLCRCETHLVLLQFPHGTYLKSEGPLSAVRVAISVMTFLHSGMAPGRSQPLDRTGVVRTGARAERASEPPALSDLVM